MKMLLARLVTCRRCIQALTLAGLVAAVYVYLRPFVIGGQVRGHKDDVQEAVTPDDDRRYRPMDHVIPTKTRTEELLSMVPLLPSHGLNCRKVFQGDPEAIEYAKHFHYPMMTLREMLDQWPCEDFVRNRAYLTSPVNKEEAEFPLAFSILVYKEELQVERLIRAIYRPQNIYCVHVDATASAAILDVMTSLAGCFPNVFVVENPVDVRWGTWTVVEAELVCMEHLLKKHKSWRYFINLTGQEFPLKTNLELVQILKSLNGSNAVEAMQDVEKSRHWDLPPPPVNVTLTKGECHVAVTRAFVSYVLTDQRALHFRDWAKQTKVPDETYFPTLSHSPQLGVPGAYTGYPESGVAGYTYITRYKCWTSKDCTCEGTVRRWLCILGPGDLAPLLARPELFLNKFQLGFRPAPIDCMEELFYNWTRADIHGDTSRLNLTFYEHLPNVRHHVTS